MINALILLAKDVAELQRENEVLRSDFDNFKNDIVAAFKQMGHPFDKLASMAVSRREE
jgi:hypothetical protein